ncbi:MAG: M23 family metallopeptidase [Syntrophales bacterium]|nr:M23 family metallopeptidase [Syntrophales bacterium]
MLIFFDRRSFIKAVISAAAGLMLVLALFAISMWAAPRASAFTFRGETSLGPVEIDSHSRAFKQGEAVMLRLKAPSFKSATALFNGFDHSFAPMHQSGEFFALLPLGLNMEGDCDIIIALAFHDGTEFHVSMKLPVSSGAFTSTALSVDPRFTSPSPEEAARIEIERKMLAEIYAKYHACWIGSGDFVIPLEGSVSSPFGVKRLFNDVVHSRHRGIDLRSATGDPVRAANRGIVVFAGSLFYAGNTVIVDHGMSLFTVYCHLSKISVKEGEMIEKGATIGMVGATGRATGPHLHWGVRLAGLNVDPLSLFHLPFR